MTARGRNERGSLAVEMAIVAPSLLLIFGLIFAYGRIGQVNGVLEAGTRDAARSATVARSHAEAESRARAAVDQALLAAPVSCRTSRTIVVTQPFRAGEPITVTVECQVSLTDIGLPGAPGSVTARSSFTSMLDPYRGVE